MTLSWLGSSFFHFFIAFIRPNINAAYEVYKKCEGEKKQQKEMKCLQKRNGENPRWRNDKLSSSPPPSNIWLVWLLLVGANVVNSTESRERWCCEWEEIPVVVSFSFFVSYTFFIFLRCHQHTIMAHLNPIRNSLDKLHQLFEERIFRVIFTLATYHWLFKELRWVAKNGFSVRHSDDDYASSSRFV